MRNYDQASDVIFEYSHIEKHKLFGSRPAELAARQTTIYLALCSSVGPILRYDFWKCAPFVTENCREGQDISVQRNYYNFTSQCW